MIKTKHSIFLNPIWLVSTFLFIFHQILQKGISISIPLIDNFADPTLGMISFLGILLQERRFFWKKTFQFSFFETGIIVLFLSLFMEEGFSRWSARFTYDPLDYIFYGLGGLIFYIHVNK